MTKSRKSYLQFIVFIGLLISTSAHAQSSYDLTTVKSKADSVFKECLNAPGCAVGIMYKEEPVYTKGYGYSNLDYNTTTTEETVFEIGSLSMHATASAIMLLENEGRISLDDNIRKYLPELPDYAEGTITIRHLLTHTSGLRDYIVLIMAGGRPLDIEFDNEDALELMSKQKSLCMIPGSSLRFSFSNYTALALIIERITEKSYAEYMTENLFGPADMINTMVYQNPQEVISNRAISYEGDAPNYQKVLSEKFTANGSLHIMTTINDFIKWNRFLKTRRLGNQSLFDKLSTVSSLNNGQQLTYRFGLEGGTFNGYELMAHNGYAFGYSAMYLNFPEEELSLIAMSSNMNLAAPGKAYDLADAILPPKSTSSTSNTTAQTRKTIKLRKKQLDKFSGDYFDSKFAYTRKVYVKGDTLRLEINPEAIRTLVPVSKNEFTIPGSSSHVSIVFDELVGNMRMSVSIDGGEPAVYESFAPANYTSNQLPQFNGEFFSEELGVTYTLKHEGTTLSTYVGERKLVDYVGIMADNFTSEHDGYISFQRDSNGKIIGFILSDYSLGSISFTKS
ncbi:serine hydrolase domain-containing protein [Roseivirga sp. 4D4]|uniref:serine hydrolase domain-containing protein n=1 Tax=Roseivirga sp. 4D4 TaxID=1889784 RepID=UPI00147B3723|nr:serine hydrolase domain-containing protein [Roseivirga sp. 4D4]